MPYVDYERVASAYQEGRRDIARTEDWGRVAVKYRVDRGPLCVLDLGAGTGIFARAWPGWDASVVLALDPSLTMLLKAREEGIPPEVQLLVGPGESIPVRTGAVHLAWLSAMVHHLRVVVPGGHVMIRGFFPGTSTVGWLPFFPGAERATARFPSVGQVEQDFAEAGFSLVAVEEVAGAPEPASRVRTWVARMREADTLLSAFGDDEFEAGLAALADAAERPLSGALHLVIFK